MFCPKCGKELPEGSLFCPDCGNKVKTVEQNTTSQTLPTNLTAHGSGNTPLLAIEDGVCPQCGTHDCEIHFVGSTTGSSGMWLCKKCGNQFSARKGVVSNLNASVGVFCGILACLAEFAVFSLIGGIWFAAILFATMGAGIFYLIRLLLRKSLGDGPLWQVLTNGLLTETELRALKKTCIWISAIFAILTFPLALLILEI